MADFMGYLVGLVAVVSVLIGLPWLIFHYVTRWKTAATLSTADEALLEEMNDMARRLDERMCSIERIMSAENPNWRAVACDPASTGIEDLRASGETAGLRRIGQ